MFSLWTENHFFFFYHRRYNMLGLLKESHFIIYLLEIPKYLPGDSCPTEAAKWKGENRMLHWESAILYGFTGLIEDWYMPQCIYSMSGPYIVSLFYSLLGITDTEFQKGNSNGACFVCTMAIFLQIIIYSYHYKCTFFSAK